jgi:hypothetical protein
MKMHAFLLGAMLAPTGHAAPTAAPSTAPAVHSFASLVIAPAGDRVASVESLQSLTSAELLHGPIVIRSVRDGTAQPESHHDVQRYV